MNSNNLYKVFLFSAIFIAFGFVSLVLNSKAEQEAVKKNSSELDQDAMMEKWKEYATPNENHRVLDAFVGDWEYKMKWWMSPDAEPEISEGTDKTEWIVDNGRALYKTLR